MNDSETSPEMRQLLGFVRYLIPVVGPSVWVLKLGCCPMLSNGLVSEGGFTHYDLAAQFVGVLDLHHFDRFYYVHMPYSD